jgi:FkbM family methyltransferase
METKILLIRRLIRHYDKYGLKATLKEIKNQLSSYQALRKQYYKAIGKQYVPSAYGVLMYANWEDITFNLCYHGQQGSILSDFLASISDDFIFLDIGANQGLYTLLAVKNSNCLKVIAFEPLSDIFSILEKNIAANGFGNKNNVIPIKAAISSENGFTEIFLNKNHTGGASLREKQGKNYESEVIKTINVVEVDKLIPNYCKIVVKIDVEGYEDVVINELIKSQSFHNISAIFYEIDERWNDPVSIQETLQSNGFSKFEKYGSGKHYDVLALR